MKTWLRELFDEARLYLAARFIHAAFLIGDGAWTLDALNWFNAIPIHNLGKYDHGNTQADK